MSGLTPDSALLDTMERNVLASNIRSVDPDHTNLHRFGDPPDPTDVPRIEIASESGIGVIRQLEHLLLGFELDQSRNRPESLFLTEERRSPRWDVRENGGLVERTGSVRALSTNEDLCAFRDGILYVFYNFADSPVVD